jgi:hypothetical protein
VHSTTFPFFTSHQTSPTPYGAPWGHWQRCSH